MRPLVYRMFVRQVERLGVRIEFNQRVVNYEEDEHRSKAICYTENGECYDADVIIAADGIGSKSQKLVGGQVRARSSGRAMWRAAFPVEHLKQNSELREFYRMAGPNGDEPIVRVYLGPGTYGMVLTRADSMVFIINHNVGGLAGRNKRRICLQVSGDRQLGRELEQYDRLPGGFRAYG